MPYLTSEAISPKKTAPGPEISAEDGDGDDGVEATDDSPADLGDFRGSLRTVQMRLPPKCQPPPSCPGPPFRPYQPSPSRTFRILSNPADRTPDGGGFDGLPHLRPLEGRRSLTRTRGA